MKEVFFLPCHYALVPAEPALALLQGIQRFYEGSIRQAREATYSQIHPHSRCRRMNRFFDFKLRLNRSEPFVCLPGDCDVLRCPGHRPGVAIADPSDFGKVYPIMAFLDLESLRKPEGVGTLSSLTQGVPLLSRRSS